MVFCKSSFVTLCLVFSIILIACTDSSSRSPEPTEGREGQGNDDFIEVSVNELRALPPGERHTIDLRPDGAAFAVKFESRDDLARVWVVDYREDTGEPDEYVLGDRAPLADGQTAGTVVFGHGDMRVMRKNARSCVCIEVCCWRVRCYCQQ